MKFNWMVFDWLSLGFKFRNPEAFEDLDFGFFRQTTMALWYWSPCSINLTHAFVCLSVITQINF